MQTDVKKKEIIVFADGLGNCGVQRVLSELTVSWANLGHKVTIAYMKENEDRSDFKWSDQVKLVGVPVHFHGGLRYLRLGLSYVRILRRRKDAVAVSLSVATNFAIGAAAPFVKNRIVISDRNDPTERPKGKIKQFFRNLAFKQADALILQTEDVREYYKKKINHDGVVIPNPINRELPEPFKGERRKVIVTASRLNKQKNLKLLIDAFSLINKEYPDYTLEIFGRGEEEESLKKYAAELRLEKCVLFKGFSTDIYSDIIDAGMYVCSSDYEGISNSLLEALGLGIPAISTDCPVGGSRLLIQNNENGILVPIRDVDALYQGMKKLIENPGMPQRLSEKAVEVRELYDIDRIATFWLDNM